MSKSTRINETVPPRTREEMQKSVSEIARLVACKQKQTADYNERAAADKAEFTLLCKEFDEEIADHVAVAKAWSEQNKAEFAGAKSIDVGTAVMGWRSGSPKLRPAKGFNMAKILAVLQATKSLARFIRVKYSVDKAAILKERATLTAATLEKMGVKISSAERFFVDAKLETVETRLQEAA